LVSSLPDPSHSRLKELGWKCRRHVGDMSATLRNVADFRPDRANLATCFLVCRHTFVSRFSDIDVPRTDEIWLSVLLIPTSNVDLHNLSPQQKAQKIIRRLHPLTSRLHLLPRHCLTSHPLCLFVRPFVCSFGWLLRRLSAPCCRVPSRLDAVPRRSATSCLLSSVLSSSSCHVIVSRLASLMYRAPPDASCLARFV
jgi:hypothetical protein